MNTSAVLILRKALVIFFICHFSAKVCGQTGSWIEKKPVPFLKPMVDYLAVAFSIGNKGYYAPATYTGQFWEYAPSLDIWTQKAHYPGFGSTRAVGFSIESKGYLGIGWDDRTNSGPKDFWEYNPATNVWVRKADFAGTGRTGAVAFRIGNKGYIGTGGNDNQFWEYNPVSDAWIKKADFPGEARTLAVGFGIGTKGYIGTGRTSSFTLKKDFWEYDQLTDTWQRKADFAGSERFAAVGFSIGNKGYVGTGAALTFENDFWEFNPSTNSWIRKADVGFDGRNGAIGFSIGDKGYLGNGFKAGGPLAVIGFANGTDFYEYNVAADKWTNKAGFQLFFSDIVGFQLQKQGYFLHLNSVESIRDMWSFDPNANTWIKQPLFPGISREAAVAFEVNNKGYLLGGIHRITGTRPITFPLNDLWQFDPITKQWSRKSDFPAEGGSFSTVFTIGSNGYVLFSNSLYEYNTLSDTWAVKASFPGNNSVSLTSFAVGGKGYVGVTNTKEFWEYNPNTDQWIRRAVFTGQSFPAKNTFVLSGQAYVLTTGRELWQYDPLLDTWRRSVDFPGTSRNNAVGLQIRDKGYLISGSSQTETWEFNPSNQPPVANGWIMKYYSSTSLLLNGWGSFDPEGGPLKYAWTKISGPSGFTMLYADASTPVISNLSVGSYTLRLTVTDNAGASASSDISFTIRENQPPVADGWLMKFNSPSSILLNSWGSYDPDGFPITFWWDKISGPSSYTMLYQNASTPVISGMVQGTYKFRLTVTDNEGAKAMDTVSVTINSLTSISENSHPLTAAEGLPLVVDKTNKLDVYPNPVKDVLNIQWTNEYVGKARISVVDVTGRTLFNLQLNKKKEQLKTYMNLSQLKAGTYYMLISIENGHSIIRRFLKK